MSTARRLSPDAARGATDLWGWCSVCRRWFYPRHASADVTCPVCATPAEKTAEQPEDSPP